MRRVILAAAMLVAMVSTTSLAAQNFPPLEGEPTLSAGDSLKLTVWRQPQYSGDFQIGGDGKIVHPLFQDAPIAGMPLSEAQERIRSVLEKYEAAPQFVMQPLLRVAVGGEVREPSLYFFDPGVTIPQAVRMAGGANEIGREDRVVLIRGAERYTLPLTGDARVLRIPIQSGDEIVVERRQNIYRDYLQPATNIVSSFATLYAFLNLVGVF